MVNDGILTAREERSLRIRELSQQSDVIALKVNMPGFYKNIPTAKLILSFFSKHLQKNGFELKEKLSGFDGDCHLFLTQNGREMKPRFVKMEDKHPLGRFCDVDVTLKNATSSMTRKKLRKCFICDQPAFYCSRNKTHTYGELVNHVIAKTESYFEDALAQAVSDSMMNELNVGNKFGLVSKLSQGSHHDLSYDLMKKAIAEIKTPITRCFFVGLNAETCTSLLQQLRPIGLLCEKSMYTATNGANAYKGFIFIGGVLLASVGYLINKSLPFSELGKVISTICQDMDSEPNKDTFGYNAYHSHGFGGIRKLAHNGFDVIINQSQYTEKPLLKTLCDIVGEIDDSVLLKRSQNFERYEYYKNLISNIDLSDRKQLLRLNALCVKNNISIGGSADVLIAVILLRKLKDLFYFGD